jgi:predicted CoA-substrate-specific enzyme activase
VSIRLGLDVGSVSVKLAAVGERDDAQLRHLLEANHQNFFAPRLQATDGLADRMVVLSTYRQILGNPMQAVRDLLRDFLARVPEDAVARIGVTGSAGQPVAQALHAHFENEFRALARSIRVLYPQVRTVFEMGGETSKYLRLSEAETGEILDYQASTECAAGTGSFLEQQASRLLYEIEDVGPAARAAKSAARVAGRCSVFAKSDMIHAQQKGYGTDQILRGLCEAVARNFKSSIVKGRQVIAPVAFVGGVALNSAVCEALREAFRLREQDLLVPDLQCWMTALGAAILVAEKNDGHTLVGWRQTTNRASDPTNFSTGAKLSLEKVIFLRDRLTNARLPERGRIETYLGIDVGSVSTNLVVIDAEGNLLKEIYVPTVGRPIEVVTAGLREIEQELGSRIHICGVGTTGSGRELIGEFTGADTVNDEITAHKTGAMHVCRMLGMPMVDTIFEIGGQDSKFIRIRDGVVIDFAMNEACAAGTGSFLEEQAEKLGVQIKGEFARLALSSEMPICLGERCTVFMARDVSSLLSKGATVADLCAGLAHSVALNYLNRVVRGRNIGEVIYFQGGTAYNDAVAAAFSGILQKPIIVPPHNGVVGAIGMALIARERMQTRTEASRFRGFDLTRVKWASRDFVCRACSNYCDMKEFTIDGEKSYWGDQCSDKFRKRSKTDRQPVIDDLISIRQRFLDAAVQEPKSDRKTVGIPRAMFYYDRLPFWATYLQELGFNVAVSPATDGRIASEGEELALAQPCFPVQVAHGHVMALLHQGVDYILLPNAVDAETPFMDKESKLCPWNQTLPFVVRAVEKLEGDLQAMLLATTVHFRQGPEFVQEELRTLAQHLGRPRKVSDRAVEKAYQAQQNFRRALQRTGRTALAALRSTRQPGIVLLGRPYNIYDPAVCCDIPRKLRSLYGINVVPLDFLPLDGEDVSDINDNMFWHSGRQVLAAAKIVGRTPGLHPIYISNFKCGPDSYLKSFLDDACSKPSLVLQFDGHSNDAGYITRCEAYLDSTGFLRCQSLNIAA